MTIPAALFNCSPSRRPLVLLASVLALAGSEAASAQTQGCVPGTRVEFADGGRGKGTIKEIGTESPHVGMYLITFDWNPRGDWYDPKTWGLRIAGTATACAEAPVAARPSPREQGAKSSAAGAGSPSAAPAAADCPMNVPPGEVSRSARASRELFQRVIYEWEAGKINPASVSAPKKIGLTFLEFEMGEPFENTLTSSRFGDKRRHDGAPEGATIYPIKTRELQCDVHGDAVRRWVSEVSGNCFKNRSGNWSCPRRTTKVVENRLLPLR